MRETLIRTPTAVSSTRARLIAFYLPQFYPISENDQWWGKGFTEWTNVSKARALFSGHYQPRLPANLGFYDLRVPSVRQAQASLATAYGIEGFCYWHYWFHGKRLLDRPFEEVLSSGEPGFPFCLSWANETWSRRWHGSGFGSEVLLEQVYSEADDVAHAEWLLRPFSDPRYVRYEAGRCFSCIGHSICRIRNEQPTRFVTSASGMALPIPIWWGLMRTNRQGTQRARDSMQR